MITHGTSGRYGRYGRFGRNSGDSRATHVTPHYNIFPSRVICPQITGGSL
jgi:hypothetical protein